MPETLDTLGARIGALSDSIDRRFEDVDRRFESIDRRFESIDRRFESIDRRFDEVTEALVEQRQYTEFAFETLRREMMAALTTGLTGLAADMTAGFGRVDRKLDRVLDSLTRTKSPRRRRS